MALDLSRFNEDAKPGTPGPRVGSHLFHGGGSSLFPQRRKCGMVTEMFDHAIFQGVIGEHGQTAPLPKKDAGLHQPLTKRFQFPVNRDPERLVNPGKFLM